MAASSKGCEKLKRSSRARASARSSLEGDIESFRIKFFKSTVDLFWYVFFYFIFFLNFIFNSLNVVCYSRVSAY